MMIRRPVLFLGLLVSFSRLAVTAEPRVHYIRYLPRASSADDCSQASFHNLSWSVTNLTFHSSIIFSTPAHQIDGATVTFNLTNTATGSDFRMKCDGRSEQLQQFFFGDIWYRCDIINANSSTEAASKSFDREAAQFRFSRPTGELVLNQAWTCRDHDPKYPISFNATGSINTTLSCNTTRWQNSNWTMGALYSSETVNCAPASYNIPASKIQAAS